MMELIREMLEFPFMTRAIFAGSLIALCAALVGVCLVLKRFSMIGDGLSHVGFSALAIASVCSLAPLAVAIPVVVVAAYLLLRIGDGKLLKGDAAIAIVSVSALAIGVLILSLTTGMTTDVNNYMFGSILSMSQADAVAGGICSVVIIALFVLIYNRMFAVTFDESFVTATGVSADKFRVALSMMTAVIIVIGLKLVGAMLISGLLIFPGVSAMKIAKSYKGVTVAAGVISVICFVTGLIVSFAFAIPSGASVIIANLLVLCICSIIKR